MVLDFETTRKKMAPQLGKMKKNRRNCAREGCGCEDTNRVRCMGCDRFYCKEHQDVKKSFYCKDCMDRQGCTICLANVQNHWMSCFTSQCLSEGSCEHCGYQVCLQHATRSSSSSELVCGICNEIKRLAEAIRASA